MARSVDRTLLVLRQIRSLASNFVTRSGIRNRSPWRRQLSDKCGTSCGRTLNGKATGLLGSTVFQYCRNVYNQEHQRRHISGGIHSMALYWNYGFIVGCPDSNFRSLQRCRRKRGVFVRAPHQTYAVQHFSLRVFSSKKANTGNALK